MTATPPSVPAFPSPFEFNFRHPVPLLELRMSKLSGQIRCKPNWWIKVQDPEVVAKWRAEIVEQDAAVVDRFWGGPKRLEWKLSITVEKQWPRSKITDAQLDYIFDQLRFEATRYDAATGIFATAVPKVYESRSLIPVTLKAPLVDGVSVLESVPEEDKDWHPGSNKQVLDLVHPSMYCLRIGQSYVRPRGDALDAASGAVKVITEKEYMQQRPDMNKFRRPEMDYVISPKFQWLPTDFEVSAEGGVRALSYINNLHPTHHRALYPAISSILARFIPLFENVLTDAINPEPQNAVRPNPHEWYNHVYSENPDVPRPYDEPDPEDSTFKDENGYWYGRWPYVPEPVPFQPPSTEGRTTVSLRGRTLQVIVKLANIVLTPDNPAYPGGSWHVEGMANEAIVATGLYYYACENITESRLDFRAAVGSEENGVHLAYEQSDDTGYMTVFGLQRESLLNQPFGGIVAEEDKCVAFPNIYQHRVDAFELADPTKPGHRKILCFFLVDPFNRIMSTTDVPPQQADWATEALGGARTLQQLPQELFDIVVDYARDDKVSRKEAEDVREQLMEERSTFVVDHNKELFEVEFYMCEH
ncbi:hypothetical protein GSI_09360 [Ganoderma sinense ZZ0214-1]|uniref:Uncharacterized protein n=1 Tax=Ganoderma sinense ZZ0214-1 TaxID=1077348 RepID=A0A2G8S697_9APHY|nr:hypothetical protein GSI_09360 [Ganoderma sinense ZZ0214-1]